MNLLNEHVAKNGKKVVVFTMYVDTADRLEYILQEAFGSELVFKVTGETKRKGAVVEAFREAEKGILLSTDTLSEGVNLEFVDILVNYDIPWTPSVLMQRVGRLWRFGRSTPIHFFNFLPPEDLTNAFSSIISRIKQKLTIIRDVLVQEIALLREGEELTEDFEERVYGNVSVARKEEYGVKKEIMDLLKIVAERGAGELGILEAKLLEMVNTLEYNSKKLRDLISEQEDRFIRLRKKIESGAVLNLSLDVNDLNKIAIVEFGKRYFFCLDTLSLVSEENMIKELEKRWNTIVQFPEDERPPISWLATNSGEPAGIDIDRVLTRFKTKFAEYIARESSEKMYSRDAKILRSLWRITSYAIFDKRRDEILRAIKELIFILTYYFFGKRSSILRRYAHEKLVTYMVVDEHGRPTRKLLDLNVLNDLLKALGEYAEKPRVEVII